MTVAPNTPRNQYVASGSQTEFTYSFEIVSSEDLQVYIDSFLQTLTTDYTVDGVGEESGGSITFVVAPAADAIITINRETVAERTTDFTTSGNYRAADINSELDRITRKLQELDGKVNRAVSLSTTTSIEGAIGIDDPQPGHFLVWDSTGQRIINYSVVGKWRGDWVSGGVEYVLNDVVRDTTDNSIYICIEDNLSGSTFSGDADKWELIIDVGQISDFAIAAGNSASAALASETAAAASETAAAASASAASASEIAAGASETAAGASETAAASSAADAAASLAAMNIDDWLVSGGLVLN